MGEITYLYTVGKEPMERGKLMFRRGGLLSKDLEWVRKDGVWGLNTRVTSEKSSEGQQLTVGAGKEAKHMGRGALRVLTTASVSHAE